MTGEARLEELMVGGRPIAVLRRAGAAPGLFWLSGFRSDMAGTKAEALDGHAARTGRACTRFDYSGHGRSGGDILEGTISRWLEEALAIFRRCTHGAQVVVGSSMGGWLALLLAKALRERGESGRLKGLVLLAPALDMTKDLIWDRFSEAEKRALADEGRVARPSAYSEAPYVFTRALIEDGERHLFGEAPISTGCPVHILQGMQDEDVPWRHALALMERLSLGDAVLTLVRDGDHRLSRPEDVERLIRAVDEMAEA